MMPPHATHAQLGQEQPKMGSGEAYSEAETGWGSSWDGSKTGGKLTHKGAPFSAVIKAVNRDQGTNRAKFRIQVNFEDQEWFVDRYYSDFADVHPKLLGSQWGTELPEFPRKQGAGWHLKKKFMGSTKRPTKEGPFIQERLKALNGYIGKLIDECGPEGIDDTDYLDIFFDAFSPFDDPNRGQCNLKRSLLHLMKKCRMPATIYHHVWNAGCVVICPVPSARCPSPAFPLVVRDACGTLWPCAHVRRAAPVPRVAAAPERKH